MPIVRVGARLLYIAIWLKAAFRCLVPPHSTASGIDGRSLGDSSPVISIHQFITESRANVIITFMFNQTLRSNQNSIIAVINRSMVAAETHLVEPDQAAGVHARRFPGAGGLASGAHATSGAIGPQPTMKQDG